MVPGRVRRQLGWLIGTRALVSTALLGGATIAQIKAPGSFPIDPFFLLIAVTYALTVAYSLTARAAERHTWLIDVQLVGDAAIVSAFIALTGGVTSFFTSLYALPIVAASMIRFRRGGLLVATLSASMYLAIVLGQYLAAAGWAQASWLAVRAGSLPAVSVARYTVALNLSGVMAVALLSGSLAENVRLAGAKLAQASSEIADLQALNEHVIESLPSGLVTTDPGHRILTFNHAAQGITGLALPEVAGRNVSEVLQLPARIAALLGQGQTPLPRRMEYRYQTADGRGDIDIGLSATHLETPGGRAGFLITFQDVTAFNKLERDARLQQRLAAVGEMAAGIAHEIRNPLASMSGSIQILRQELPLNEEQEQLMDIVLRESDRLNTTIRSFLEYARPQRFAVARVDVRRVINDAALLLRNNASVQEGHTIDVNVPTDEVWYDADENQIRQIVWNLATNGLRAMPEGGRLRLAARLDRQAEGVVIAVEDEGIGIAPEELDGLFEPFHGRFAKGSGLGLAIVHRIVADYGGEIQVRSQPGAGTTVSIHLPAQAVVTT